MAPIAITPEASPVPTAKKLPTASTTPSPQWLDDLATQGYAVVRGAIPTDRALSYQRAAHDWLTSFGTPLDLADRTTWTKANLPVQSSINTFHAYCQAHEKFMWDARLEPGVVDVFERIWATRDLLVSFDSANITLPNRTDKPRKPAWEHVDQSPLRRGKQCVQGVINLSPSGPDDGGLVVYPGSHRLVEDFFDSETDRATWEKKDIYMFSKEQLAWFHERGLAPHKVVADVGDLLIWDSRLIHYGAEPTEKSNQIRTVIYASYTPAAWASAEQLKLKQEVFSRFGGTTHWPHDNIWVRDTVAYLEDGTVDPRNRKEPLNKPEFTPELLKLAGVLVY